jgi:predicted dehydrogenase
MTVLDNQLKRRELLRRTVAGIAALGLPAWAERDAIAVATEAAAARPRRIGPNDRIRIGLIGSGGSKGGFRQGWGITSWAKNHGCEIVAVCDVERQHREEARAALNPQAALYNDYRELLARNDIDAVTIGTPDHWHAQIAWDAMDAGKDVYCEKPLTLVVHEGTMLVKKARDKGRVFQVGSQQRSSGEFRTACELVRNGRVGRLKKVEAHLPGGSAGGPFPVRPVPEGLDWNMWLGPAPYVEYVPERTHGSFRHWFEYSGGMMTDWGAHHNDIAQWALGMDSSGPVRVESTGTRPEPKPHSFNTFVTFKVTYTYPNGVPLITSNEGENGVLFDGENGWIFVSRGVLRASDERLLKEPLPANAVRLYKSDDHMGNFLDCMRSRQRPICDVEVGHRSVSVCHIGNISLRTGGRPLHWDPRAERFTGDGSREANALLMYRYRNPWREAAQRRG